MSKIYLICGKICSGKTYYAKQFKEKYNAVILSTDEATFDLIDNEQGDFYNVFAARVNGYLKKKAAEIALAGANVILDWGFWTKKDRADISAYFAEKNIPFEWHYIDIDDEAWEKNIAERNAKVSSGNGGADFYVDKGLLAKVNSLFEPPQRTEIDFWHTPER